MPGLACIHTHRVPLPLLLLLLCTDVIAAAAVAVGHVPDFKNTCWFIGSDSIEGFVFFRLKHYILLMYVSLGSTVAFTAKGFL